MQYTYTQITATHPHKYEQSPTLLQAFSHMLQAFIDIDTYVHIYNNHPKYNNNTHVERGKSTRLDDDQAWATRKLL